MWQQVQIYQHWGLIKLEQTFYDHLNNGEKYLCDRCNVVELLEHEYKFNHANGSIYCELCWNWIHLKKWTDEKGNKHTLRSEREIITCQKNQ